MAREGNELMPGNSKRRGAIRKPGTKKGASTGSGGRRRDGLEGRGPTPKASERTGHPARARKAAQERKEQSRPKAVRRGGVAQSVGDAGHLVTGRNAVLEAARAGVPVQRLFLAPGAEDDRVREIISVLGLQDVRAEEVPRGELDDLTDGQTHQGVVAVVPEYDYADPGDLLDRARESGRPPLVVALDGITDPHNLGAVLRSAGAFGAHGVVVPQRRSAGVTPAVWKVSAGAVATVPVARAANLVRALETYQRAGLFVVGLDGGAEAGVDDLELATEGLVVVLGAEGAGLSRLVRQTCDLIVSIPIASSVESLNAAVAAGITLHEVARRRRG